MKKIQMAMAAAFAFSLSAAHAEDALKRGEITYDKHMVRSDQKNLEKGQEKKSEADKREEYAKQWVEFSQKMYDKSLKANGANNELTKDAKDKYDQALKEYGKAQEDNRQAKKDYAEDQNDLRTSQKELSKDKADAQVN